MQHLARATLPIALSALVAALVALAVVQSASPESDPVPSELSDAAVRQAVARALPYLEEHGVAWMEEQECASCHQVPIMIWSYHEALGRGLEVDSAKVAEWTRWTLDDAREPDSDNTDGVSQIVLGRLTSPADEAARAELAELVRWMASEQEEDGSWAPQGQLPQQRRPKEETRRIATTWAALALSELDPSNPALARARAFLAADPDPLAGAASQEAWVTELLYAVEFGDSERARKLVDRLLAEQHGDGGWAWIRGEASDGFATGQVLYALERAGVDMGHAAVARARTYLVRTQEDDGSWPVRSTLARKDGVTPTGRYWGTGWAVIGLLRTLPADAKRAAPLGTRPFQDR